VLGIETAHMSGYLSGVSTWVFLSRDEGRLRALADLALERRRQLGLGRDSITLHRPTPDERAKAPSWTDDYSDLFGALRPLPVRFAVDRSD
jgi:hypothetical protein